MRKLLLVMALILSACAAPAPTAPDGASGEPASAPGPVICAGREGSPIDVATEPGWRAFADYRTWTTAEDGCVLRIDVIGDRPGPAHCRFDAARVIVTGRPVGARYTNSQDATEYVRDPDDVQGDAATAAGFDPDAKLPDDAVDTEFRQDGTELWVDPDDPSAIYLVGDDRVERWPRDPTPAVCR